MSPRARRRQGPVEWPKLDEDVPYGTGPHANIRYEYASHPKLDAWIAGRRSALRASPTTGLPPPEPLTPEEEQRAAEDALCRGEDHL